MSGLEMKASRAAAEKPLIYYDTILRRIASEAMFYEKNYTWTALCDVFELLYQRRL